jgi:hypothetical protein
MKIFPSLGKFRVIFSKAPENRSWTGVPANWERRFSNHRMTNACTGMAGWARFSWFQCLVVSAAGKPPLPVSRLG